MVFLPSPSFEIKRPPAEPPLHGLLNAAYTPDLSDIPEADRDRWQSGITFPSARTTCDDRVSPWLGWTDNPQDKAGPGINPPYNNYQSFVLTYSTHCQVLPSQLDSQVTLAKEALEAGTSQAVESIFWGPNNDGPLADLFTTDGGNFSLSGSTPMVTGYGFDSCSGILNRNPLGGDIVAVSPKVALFSLTQALGNCGLGTRGYIHAPIYLAEEWAASTSQAPNSENPPPFITRIRGDYVVGGSGYSGVGPIAHPLHKPADGYSWAYATGPVGVLLSETREQETTLIDNRNNLHKIIVERTVAIAADASCLFAVYVDVA